MFVGLLLRICPRLINTSKGKIGKCHVKDSTNNMKEIMGSSPRMRPYRIFIDSYSIEL